MRERLKRLIGRRNSARLRVLYDRFDFWVIEFFSCNSYLAVAYGVINGAYRREMFATLKGRVRYGQQLRSGTEKSSSLLRRNIHRLEKGLVMRPRRAVFSEAYIDETVECFAKVQGVIEEDELKWATDVLTNFFSIVELGKSKTISQAHDKFLASIEGVREMNESEQWVPYARNHSLERKIPSYEEFLALCQRRRSVRWYESRVVEQNLLEMALVAAGFAPSACNRQPFEFRLVTEPSYASKLGAMAGGTGGFFQNFSALAVVIGDLSSYKYEKDRHLIYIDAALASMQFMLALETLGLSSCPINWPDVDYSDTKMQRELNLPLYKRPIMLISIGYADGVGMIPYSKKKAISLTGKFAG